MEFVEGIQQEQNESFLINLINYGDIQKVKQVINSIKTPIHKIYDNNNSTLLHLTTNHNNYQLTQYFLKLYDQRIACSQQNYTEQSKKRWINQKDKDGFYAIHYAVFRGSFKMANLLQLNFADIYAINDQGLTVLHIAAQGDSPALMYYYLNKGFKISVTDFKGSTPLHWACYSGQQNSVNALLAWQAEMDRQDTSYGMTPLHLAVLSGNGRIVKKLLLRGCDRNIKNFANKLAVQIAKQNQYINIQAMIEDKGLIKQILNIKTPFRKTKKYTYHFFFLIIVFLANYVLNVSFVVSQHITRIFEMCIVFLSLGLVCIIFFLILRVANPGYLKIKNNQKKYFFQILIRNSPDKICYDCQIIKPDRSRHCQICESCVSVFDHHCPWIGKCVGSVNYFIFYMFLLSLELFMGYSIAFQIVNLIVEDLSNISTLLFIRSFCICLSLVTCAIFFLPITFLILVQTRNLILDQTTFEKYSNNFNQTKTQSSSRANSNINTPILSDYLSRQNNYSTMSIKKSITMQDRKFLQKSNCFTNCYRMCFGNKNNISYNIGGF